MIKAVNRETYNFSKNNNISFNGQLNLIVQKTLYRNSTTLPQITSENIGRQYPKVLSCENSFVKGIFEMSKQFIKLIPDDMKVFFEVLHSNGKSKLKSFSYKIADAEKTKNFHDLYHFAEALNTEAKKLGIYKKKYDNKQIDKFTEALDRYADFFSIRARIDRTRIIDIDAQEAVKVKMPKVSKSKQKKLEEFANSLKGLMPEEFIEKKVAEMAQALS